MFISAPEIKRIAIDMSGVQDKFFNLRIKMDFSPSAMV